MAIIIENNRAPIQTVVPSINLGEIQLSADRRSTKDEKLTDAQRIRRVVLPVNHWGNIVASKDEQQSQGLTDILREALRKLGSARLADTLEESPQQTSVALSDYTVAELLKWSEETATSRGSITFTRVQAEEWFSASTMLAALKTKWESNNDTPAQITAKVAFLKNRFGALAAKNHGIATAADALKLQTLMEASDCEAGVGMEVVGRLEHIVKALTAKEAEATVSMSDL